MRVLLKNSIHYDFQSSMLSSVNQGLPCLIDRKMFQIIIVKKNYNQLILCNFVLLRIDQLSKTYLLWLTSFFNFEELNLYHKLVHCSMFKHHQHPILIIRNKIPDYQSILHIAELHCTTYAETFLGNFISWVISLQIFMPFHSFFLVVSKAPTMKAIRPSSDYNLFQSLT